MKKEVIVQILSDWSEQYGKTYEERCIFDNDFDDLADVIIKNIESEVTK